MKYDADKVGIFSPMDTAKRLYRELAKVYHPDKSTTQAECEIFGQLMIAINDAAAAGDVATLTQIKTLGPIYLVVKMYSENQFSRGPHQSDACSYDRPRTESRGKRVACAVKAALCLLHPYCLWFMLDVWGSIGRVSKLTALGGAVGWTFLFAHAWWLLDRASTFCTEAGFPHDSWAGLIIVLLRGGVILAALPCLFSLLVVGFFAAMILGFAILANSLASAILGVFHPLLTRLPAIIVVPLTVWALWRMVGKDVD